MEEKFFTNHRAGFTLIEIVISITILVLALGMISFKVNMESILVENTAHEITSAIRYTKQLCESGDKSATFSIEKDTDGYYYRITEIKDKISTVTLEERIDDRVILFQKEVKESYTPNNKDDGHIQLNMRVLQIKFSGSSGTGTSLLLKGKSTKNKYKITVIPTSARIHLYKYA